MDVLWMLGKDPAFRDNPTNSAWIPGMPYWERQHRVYSEDWPTSHDYARFLRSVIDEFDDRLMVAEVVLPPARNVAYYGNDDEAHLPLNFALINLTSWSAGTAWDAIDNYVRQLRSGMWANWFVGNHDWGRISNRAGFELLPLIQTLLMTLRGTPFLYYGDELAMLDASIPQELSTDPQKVETAGRDREAARAPMPWTSEHGYGFTQGQPWLPFAPRTPAGTVAEQRQMPNSLLNITRTLLMLRRENEALSSGEFALGLRHSSVLSYSRSSEGKAIWVHMNFSKHRIRIALPPNAGRSLFSTRKQRRRRTLSSTTIQLGAYEALIIESSSAA
jgi:alpha-glucosidase